MDKTKVDKIIKRLEVMKKTGYSSSELRGGNQMMKRLDRMQEKDFIKRIDIAKTKLKDKSFVDDLLYDGDMEDKDVLKILGIKEKGKVRNNRRGFFGDF